MQKTKPKQQQARALTYEGRQRLKEARSEILRKRQVHTGRPRNEER